jgi:hypothetical protein
MTRYVASAVATISPEESAKTSSTAGRVTTGNWREALATTSSTEAKATIN